MTKLPSREVDLFRSLKKTAIVLMLLFRLDRPPGECEIGGILEMDRGTIRIHLRSLAHLGMVTRSHRYHGWILTAGGRQMVLGESSPERLEERAGEGMPMVEAPPSVMVENPSSSAENSSTMVENPPSLPATESLAMMEKPPSMAKIPPLMREKPPSLAPSTAKASAKVENPPSIAENPSSSAENPPSPSLAAASLSLNSLSFKAIAAAAIPAASAEIPPSTAEFPPPSGKICRSRLKPRMRKVKSEDRTANGGGGSDRMVQANLKAFASIGLAQNDFVLRICGMDHVTPAYILGQKKRLEAERRYSPGLLLTVIECKDALPEKYAICDSSPVLSRAVSENSSLPLSGGAVTESVAQGASAPPFLKGAATETTAQGDSTPPFSRGAATETTAQGDSTPPFSRGAGGDSPPDPSIHVPLSASGMTAAKAWPSCASCRGICLRQPMTNGSGMQCFCPPGLGLS